VPGLDVGAGNPHNGKPQAGNPKMLDLVQVKASARALFPVNGGGVGIIFSCGRLVGIVYVG
jgi:hypothetical protein